MIEIQRLTKRCGEHPAVPDLSFTVYSGQIYGFPGPNGAGKSTTMNICTGCLSTTGGSVRVDGYDIFEQPKEAKKRIGYLPELPPLYMNEMPLEYLRFVGEAKGLRGTELDGQIAEVIRQTKIENISRRRIAALSKGYEISEDRYEELMAAFCDDLRHQEVFWRTLTGSGSELACSASAEAPWPGNTAHDPEGGEGEPP